MRLTKTTAIILLACFAIGALAGLARAQQVGLKFPMYVQDPVTGEPVTGAWIYASSWESRPPIKVGGSATETSGGFYYFVLGDTASCDSCIPSDYYDLWVNNTLDSARAGIPIGPGGMVLACDMINSCHIIDDEVRLDADMENDYGTDSTETGNVYTVEYVTKHGNATAAAPLGINVADHGTGTTQSMVAALDILHTATGKDDRYSSPRGVTSSLVTDPDYPVEVPDAARTGPVAFNARVRCDDGGYGSWSSIVSGSGSSGMPIRYSTAAGYGFMVDVDSLGSWWQSDLHQAAGIYGKIYARQVRNARGIFITTDTDSSVYYAKGAEIIVAEGGLGCTPHAHGTDVYVSGSVAAVGHQVEAWGLGNGASTYGITVTAQQDTANYDAGNLVYGVKATAARQGWGVAGKGQKQAYGGHFRASADTAYGIQAMAQSDEDNVGNRAYGVYGAAAFAPVNYGVWGEATYINTSATNYGVYGKASGGATNWAGYFDGPVYMSGAQTVEDLSVGTLTLDDAGSDAVTGVATILANSDTIRVTADDATGSGACTILLTPLDRFPDQGDSLMVSHITGGAFTIYAGWQTANQDYYWTLIKR